MWVSLQYGASGTLGCGTGIAPEWVDASLFTIVGLVLWFEPALEVCVGLLVG